MVTSRSAWVETDVCIVGAGPVGLVLATTLASRGARVVLLERGPAKPGFETPQPNESLDGIVDAPRFEPLWSSRSSGVGGTSRIWNTIVADTRTAKYAPLARLDLEARPGRPHTGWPFGMATLAPFLHRAAEVCGLDPASAPAPAGTLGPFERHLFGFGPREPFTQTLAEHLGRADDVTLLTGASVVGLETTDGGRRVTAVRWVSTDGSNPAGSGGVVRATQTILAAGTLENARLLLATARQGTPAWAASAWLGRGFMEHPVDRSLALHTRSPILCPDPGFFGPHLAAGAPAAFDSGHPSGWRMGRLTLPEEWLRAEGLPNVSIRFTTQEATPAVLDAPAARSWARRLVPGSALRRRIGDGVRGAARLGRRLRGLTYRLNVDLEQWPHPDNRVTLADRVDAAGLPCVALHWRWTPEDERCRERLLTRVVSALAEAGLGRVERAAGFAVDPNAHHHAGTTRMHPDPAEGVVDGDLRVHGSHNLFVCGGSVFPTAGAVNPTLTALALALRLADHLRPSP